MSEQTNLPADVAAPSPPVIAKAGMAPGGALAALVPQSLDDAFRLAKALASAGDMVPKHFQGKPEATMAAIVRGMEIGLAPMQALSNIAVINGRASIWGDALPALLQRAGHHIDVTLEGSGDDMKAVATLTRGDTGRTVTREFSVADAKRAGLWNKQGPWQQYPQRMLQMRARAFAVRDGAADAMMGLQVAEEASDMTPIRDVTPKTTDNPLAQKALAAREAAKAKVETPDAEVLPPEGIDYENLDTASAFPGSDQWQAGEVAREDGKPITACPYDEEAAAIDWCGGWREADARIGKGEGA